MGKNGRFKYIDHIFLNRCRIVLSSNTNLRVKPGKM